MSQQKVDKYKADKANRSQIIKKKRRMTKIEITAAVVVMAGLLGWFGASYYGRVEEAKPPVEYPMDSSAIDDYLSGLDTPAEEAGDDITEEQ